MKNKKVIYSVLIIVLALAGIFAICSNNSKSSPGSVANNTVQGDKSQKGNTSDKENKDNKDENSSETDDAEKSEASSSGSDSNGGQSSYNNKSPYPEFTLEDIRNENAHNQQNQTPTYSLPYTIPGTGVTIERIGDYSGIFIEDGSDSEVSNVATILLRNTSDQDIELVNIRIEQNQDLEFQATNIPAGKQVVVQEISGTAFADSSITSISGSASEGTEFDQLESMVSITDDGKNSLKVKNVSSETIPTLRIFYKFYSPDDDAYIGGITYNAKINNLKPGAEEIISPSHYQSGSSKVTMVKAYEEVQ